MIKYLKIMMVVVIFAGFLAYPACYATPMKPSNFDDEVGLNIEDAIKFEYDKIFNSGTTKEAELIKSLLSGAYSQVLQRVEKEFSDSEDDPEILSIKAAALIGTRQFSEAQNELVHLYQLNSVSELWLSLIAQQCLKVSRPDMALQVCQKGLEKNVNDPTLLFYMGLALKFTGKPQMATVYFEKLLKSGSGTKRNFKEGLNNIIAATYLELNEFEKAKDLFKNDRIVNPESLVRAIAFARYHASQGQYDDAIKVFDGIHQNEGAVRLSKAQIFILSGEADKAASLLEKKDNTDSKTRYEHGLKMLLALARLMQDRPKESLSILANEPLNQSPGFRLSEAAVYMALGDKSGAIQALSKAPLPFIEIVNYKSLRNHLEPPVLGPILGLSYFSFDRGYYRQTIKIAKQFIEKLPNNIFLHLLLAESYNRTEKYDEAIVEYKIINKIMPESYSLRLQLARTLEDAGKRDEALALLVRIVNDRPDFLQAQLFYGELLEGSGQWEKARKTYESGLNFTPDSPYLLMALGWTLTQLKDFNALEPVVGALKRNVKVKQEIIQHLEGWRAYQQGDISAAIALLEKAQLNMPGDPELCYHLGMAMLGAGQRKKAENLLEQAFLFRRQRDRYQKLVNNTLSGQ
jgi:tetratricopeptide (TPR) repeat protein